MKIALLTHRRATRCAVIASALAERGIRPDLIICEAQPQPPAAARLRQLILERGPQALADKLLARLIRPRAAASRDEAQAERPPDAPSYAAQHDIPLLDLPDLNSAASLDRLKGEAIDLMVHAGAGILRAPLLAIPRLSVLNAHMGVLPRYRGMNVAEWAAWENGPLGATVHWIDPGIDTGRIIRVAPVDFQGIGSVAALRAAVDKAQIAALADLVAEMVASDHQPSAQAQSREDGRQYFTMHPMIVGLLEQRLAQSA
ncbi:formyl transferase-like protein [Blastomonas natatoria]|uniref:phosphoribosylglycinamide formyltransferase 1 n=1 Tax=Blastomonas natatoria TaxID=34015 RepID=A0A2V3V978_9SPHN|nr:formyltransferase family protein [Blastomonas natatoria]PXW77714.1 formyl transferase-like protein [Blastomonas natatoria]